MSVTPTEISGILDSAKFEHKIIGTWPESADYSGYSILVNDLAAQFRVGKSTPTKLGHFVTFWVRSTAGPIRPFAKEDAVERFLVYVSSIERHGLFDFPVAELVRRGVVSVGGVGGKRALRVYAPWVAVTSAQAKRTQAWQAAFYVPLPDDDGLLGPLLVD